MLFSMDNNQNFQSPAPQVLPPSPSPVMPTGSTPPSTQPYVPSSANNHPLIILCSVFLAVLIAAVAGTYFLQQGKINKLNQQISSLKGQNNSQGNGGSGGIGSLVFGGEQQQARDSKRMADIKSIQTQLEAFFSQNGYYPSLSDMNSSSWISTNMKSLDTNALTDPSNSSNSTKLASQPTKGQYAYQPADSNGQSCENSDTNCAQYTLTAELESQQNGSSTYVVKNLD